MNLAELGRDSDWVVGPSLWGTFKKLGVVEERLDEAVNLYRDRYNVKGYIENSVYEGIPDQLATLKSVGYLLCVATAKPTISAISILEYFELRQYFSYEFGSNLDGSLSDKSALLKHALEVTGIDPKDSLSAPNIHVPMKARRQYRSENTIMKCNKSSIANSIVL